MPQAVIFDIDGTLVDSVNFHAEAWVQGFEKFGHSVDFATIKQRIGKGGEYILEEFLTEAENQEYGSDLKQYRKQYFHDQFLPKIQALPQVRALFERIRQDQIQIVLATSAEQETANHYREMLGIKDLIDGMTCSDDVENAKPEPDIFQAALKKLDQVAPESVIVVGDSPYDAAAAQKLSLRTLGFLSGGFSTDQLREAGCVAIYKDPADLLAHYQDSLLNSASLS
ncbi:MAG: HAD family phosphatase [Leptolyngbyaceae cyanobacterium SM1_1_3]|nr:HAD family phosphatase [Leptolyngbyaceae cyanobacterium SM1_1_3]NJM85584.1 HAD family phosphatase [Leptolyngbyaceae cyanobacterium RM2_2_21]NJN02955.1 HAD family phosphatase [Leptolyngbyaceae cyanobacterium RM1_1_2]NJO08843.1 HAD family phosphatase [Leptolyngbyaceae cyanobacterium SL_1_1]